MVDVGMKGISRTKFDCSLDSNVFFMCFASIFECLLGVGQPRPTQGRNLANRFWGGG